MNIRYLFAIACACLLAGNSTAEVQLSSNATYDAGSGVLRVYGSGFAFHKFDPTKFSLSGEPPGVLVLSPSQYPTALAPVSDSQIDVVLTAGDRNAANLIFNRNGTISASNAVYNLQMQSGWSDNAPPAATILIVSNVPVATLNSGTITTDAPASTKPVVASVQRQFVYYLFRPADFDELSTWVANVTASGNTEALSAYLGASSEHQSFIDQYSAQAAISVTYFKLFGREITGDALAFWYSQVLVGQVSINHVGRAMAESMQGAELNAVNNKVKAAILFTSQIDTPAERSCAATANGHDRLQTYLFRVSSDATFADFTTPSWLVETFIDICNVLMPFLGNTNAYNELPYYDVSTGILNLAGSNFTRLAGDYPIENDIDVRKFTIVGDGDPYTLTTPAAEVNDSRFALIFLNTADRVALASRMTKSGSISAGNVPYKLVAAQGWMAGADPAVPNANPGINFAVRGAGRAAFAGMFSRKLHGGTNHDLPIDLNRFVGDNPTVEPRQAGAGHQVVFKFTAPIASIYSSYAYEYPSGQDVPVTAEINAQDPREVIVKLNAIPDKFRGVVSVGTNDHLGTSMANNFGLAFLLGDVSGSGRVSASDIVSIRAHLNQPVNADNYRFSLTGGATITEADLWLVKAQSGSSIP